MEEVKKYIELEQQKNPHMESISDKVNAASKIKNIPLQKYEHSGKS